MYCQRVVGDVNFSIEEWNKQNKLCNDLGIEMPSDDLPECKEQCFECMAIVGERQRKTREAIEGRIDYRLDFDVTETLTPNP